MTRTDLTTLPRARRRPWRVALLTHGLTIGGGVPVVARWLAEALRATGDYVVELHDLATSRSDPASRRLSAPRSWLTRSLHREMNGPTHHHWGANLVEAEPMRYRPRRQLSAHLRGYDLVQVVAGTPAWAGPALGLGVPVVLQVATLAAWEREAALAARWSVVGEWRRAMTRWVSARERVALRQVDRVLVENTRMADFTRALGQRRVRLAPPGVDTTVFAPSTAGHRPDGHLLAVSRLGDPRKGLDRLVRAYAELTRSRSLVPDLVLAGRGALSGDVESLIAGLGLGRRVVVRGDVSVDELVELYRGASVFVQTSYEEGLGIAVLEAMACGLPVVATATAGTAQTVLDGDTGWLIPLEPAERVPGAVAARVGDLLDGPAAEFGRRGRARCVEHFSTEVTFRRFLATYEELLSDEGRLGAAPRATPRSTPDSRSPAGARRP